MNMNTKIVDVTPVDINSIPKLDGIRELRYATKISRFEVRSAGRRSKFDSRFINLNYFVIPNARLINYKGFLLAITETNKFFPLSFPKPWVYSIYANARPDFLSVELPNVDEIKISTDVFAPITFSNCTNLFHAFLDNFGRLAWRDDLGDDLPIIYPINIPVLGIEREIRGAFLKEEVVLELPVGVYKVDRLILPPPGNWNDYMVDRVITYVSSVLKENFRLQSHTHLSRLFISRADTRVRNLVNEPELIAALRKYGFFPICPGDYSLRAQLEIFSSAEAVFGVHGMGFTPILATTKCRKIVEIEAFRWDYTAYSAFAACMGIEYKSLGAERIADEGTGTFHWLARVNIDAVIQEALTFRD